MTDEFDFNRLQSLNVNTRMDAAHEIRCLSLPRNRIQTLISILMSSPDENVRTGILVAIAKNRFVECGSTVLRVAQKDMSQRVKETALNTLVQLEYRACLPYLNSCLICNNGKSTKLMEYAVYALGEFKCQNSIDNMFQIVRLSGDDGLRANAIRALKSIARVSPRRGEIIEFLKQYLNDTSALVQIAVKDALDSLNG